MMSSYRADLSLTGGVQVGLWRPRANSGPVALLLGRTPQGWYGTNISDQARELVAAGYWVVSVDTPNWGNATDVANIDTALSWMQTKWGRATDRLVVVAHNAGCAAALNWSQRNFEKVASLSLQAPILDLAERYGRLAAANSTPVALSLSGANGTYVYTNDHNSLDITGDIDIRAEIAATDWTPAAIRSIVSKYANGGNQRSYRFCLLSSGLLQFGWTADGTTQLTSTSTAAPVVSDGATLAVRVTLDVNNGAAGRTTTFYTAPTLAGPWTQLGSTVIVGSTTSILSSTAALEIGGVDNGFEAFQGSVFTVEVRNGIAGTVVANPVFSKPGVIDFDDAAGRHWWLSGAANMFLLASGGAETDAMEAAYGGTSTTFVTAMPIWNPVFLHRKYAVKDMLGNRMKIWWSSSDTQTPPAVTDDLATVLNCDTGTLADTDPVLVDPVPMVSQVVSDDTAWTNQAGLVEAARWRDYARTSLVNAGYRSGDSGPGCVLPDGRIVTLFADTGIGTLDPDDTFGIAFVTRNSMIIQNADLSFAGQHYSGPPGSNPPFVPDQGTFPTRWYWPHGVMVENGQLHMISPLLVPDGFFGTAEDYHIISMDASTFAIQSTTSLGLIPEFRPVTLLPDPTSGYTYINTDIPSGMARVPSGQLLTPGAWQAWNGNAWVSDLSQVAGMVDTNQNPIQYSFFGDDTAMRRTSTGFVLALVGAFEPELRLYRSSLPQGPWEHYRSLLLPSTGELYGGLASQYLLNWHPHLDVSPNELMLSYNVFSFGASAPLDRCGFGDGVLHFIVVPTT
ncbi:MAG TPA: hypothetical protein VK674_04555 [Candidatus Limnocylindria bacterium]|nr:hypothetical protein [Candidatus Limnocylindria bacterium]